MGSIRWFVYDKNNDPIYPGNETYDDAEIQKETWQRLRPLNAPFTIQPVSLLLKEEILAPLA
ncbi:MAG: hypothetical protein E6R03_18170 [Hyphomicrobiaceae bacterium]|nr:MAG: hypothetical protein E6R03_18170 [Hyphomicrobiaceae bacterium]